MFDATIAFPDLLADAGAGATVTGGIIGIVLGEAAKSRRSLEDLALGAAVGGFSGCCIAIVADLFINLTGRRDVDMERLKMFLRAPIKMSFVGVCGR